MEKKELASILSEVLVPLGFKNKGTYWVINGDEITKMVNLQKSQFNNSFFINYGYILKSIPLIDMMHIYNRVTSLNVEERNRMEFLLNLDSKISDVDRAKELKGLLQSKLITKIQAVNTEDDLLTELKKRPHLNDITLDVKKHFGIVE
jgi:hypothetical protein